MSFKKSFHPYAMTTIFFWSLAYVNTRLALKYFSPFAIGFLRYAVAALAMLIVVLVQKIKPPKAKDMIWFALSGATGFFTFATMLNLGSRTVNSSTSSVIVATTPIMTAILARIFYKEKLTKMQYCAIAVSFIGVLVLTVLSGGLSVNKGILYLIIAAFALSLYNIFQKRLTRTYSSLCSTAYSIFWGALFMCVFMPNALNELPGMPFNQIWNILILGVLSSAVAYCTWSKAFSLAEHTSSVSNYMFVTPFVTSLIAFIVAGESVTAATIVGGAFIVAGLIIFNFGNKIIK